jgi:hypothetical protein
VGDKCQTCTEEYCACDTDAGCNTKTCQMDPSAGTKVCTPCFVEGNDGYGCPCTTNNDCGYTDSHNTLAPKAGKMECGVLQGMSGTRCGVVTTSCPIGQMQFTSVPGGTPFCVPSIFPETSQLTVTATQGTCVAGTKGACLPGVEVTTAAGTQCCTGLTYSVVSDPLV